jgi:hypothetical protein
MDLFIIIRHRDAKGPDTDFATVLKVIYSDAAAVQTQALVFAAANPGEQYDVYKIVPAGSALSPAPTQPTAVWSP